MSNMVQGRLIIMRHGQTQYNVEKKMTGKKDVPLTAEGVRQGQRAGQVLKHFNIHAAYSSPLKRAFNTMKLSLDAANTHENLRNKKGVWHIELRDSLMEKDVGDYTGLNHKTDPRITKHKWQYGKGFPNGESDRDVVERVRKLYEAELKPLIDQGKTVCVSCHAGVKRAFMVVLDEIQSDKMLETQIPNAQPWVVEFDRGLKKGSYFIDPEKIDRNLILAKLKKQPNQYKK